MGVACHQCHHTGLLIVITVDTSPQGYLTHGQNEEKKSEKKKEKKRGYTFGDCNNISLWADLFKISCLFLCVLTSSVCIAYYFVICCHSLFVSSLIWLSPPELLLKVALEWESQIP